MTMRVTILTTVMGESGSLLTAGSTYTVSKAFGAALVGDKRATDTDGVLTPPQTEMKPYLATDPITGNVTGLVGPGGGVLRPKFGRQLRLAGLGDSITINGITSTVSLKYHNNVSYLAWAAILSKQAVKHSISDNFGVGGDTTTMVRARVMTVISAAPDICVVHCGTNDIYGGVSYATTTDNLAYIWGALTGAGITVIVVPVLPRAKDSTSGLLPLNLRYRLQRINAWIRKTAPSMSNVYVADPTANIVDYTATGSNLGDPIGGISAAVTAYTYDGLHPAVLGAYWMGKAVADVIALNIPAAGAAFNNPVDVFDATENPNGNVILNGLLTGTGGTLTNSGALPSGTVATSWTLQGFLGTVAGSSTSLTLPNGATVPQQTIVLGASSSAKIYQGVSSLGGLSTGDTVYSEVEVTVTGATNLNGFFSQLYDSVTTTRCLNGSSGAYYPSQTWTGVLRTPEFVLGPSASLTTWLQFQTAAAGGVTVDIRNWSVRKVP